MKRRVLVWLGLVAATGVGIACGDDGPGASDATAEIAAGETDVSRPETEVTLPDADATEPDAEVLEDQAAEATEPEVIEAEVSQEITPGQVTWDDVYPIFATSCAPCHTGATPTRGSGGHSIASTDKAVAYAASQLDADVCPGKTVGECALVRIQNGSMPATGECQNPLQPKCPDMEAQALIQTWIDQGMLGPSE